MITPFLLALVASTAPNSVLGLPGQSIITPTVQDASVDDFIATENPIALSNILCNIGANGYCVPGASEGLVIASPSKANPDYFYTWTRDSALTFKSLVDIFINKYDSSLQSQIEKYISAQAQLQPLFNPSGGLSDGAGLGEPKFNADGTPFTGNWGRPQRDGPALRAITLITYSKWLITQGYNSTVNDNLWPIIKNDLSYVAQYWNETGFDLWEEVYGSSFFTLSTQHRALVEGSGLAKALGKSCPMCNSQAPQVLCFLQSFWDLPKGYILANINTNTKRSAKDSSTILASIHQFDPSLVCDSRTFQPCSDVALANHKIVTDSFRSVYSINHGIPEGSAVSVGRYPEDVYYHGNPWYLSTLAAAEQLYDALYVWHKHKIIKITDISLSFFRDFSPTIQTGAYDSTSSQYKDIYAAVLSYADEYFKIVAAYTQINGSLSEQFDKVTGQPLSAYDLTWSYAALLTAAARRSSVIPYSWASSSTDNPVNEIPSQCVATPERGTYSVAPTFTWPAHQTPSGIVPDPTTRSTSSTTSCTPIPTVLVTLNELATTTYGDSIKVVGSTSNLGIWDPDRAIPLSALDYSAIYPVWQVKVPFAAGTTVSYKYLNFRSDGTLDWEGGSDHTLQVPSACKTAISVIDSWQSD
ncbi:Glucoamylase [Podosphaera aphanis]|nr:Glucoamylase [Podosphaera aphanis]